MSEEVVVQPESSPKDEKQRFGNNNKKMIKPIRRKPCSFCIEKCTYIDYKDVNRLKKYLTEKGKIVPRRQTGLCAGHQREITTAVKRARIMSLI